MTTDQFGITKINETLAGGREWFSNWTTNYRSIRSAGTSTRNQDPYDSMSSFLCTSYKLEGNKMVVYGDSNGECKMSGDHPRLYVNLSNSTPIWLNVEMTCYAKLISPKTGTGAYTTFRLCGRSNHQAINSCICNGTGYSSEFFLPHKDSRFRKELLHPHYANKSFVSYNPGLNEWLGMKLIIRSSGNDVNIECWIDKTNGSGGGSWTRVGDYTDGGSWAITESKELVNITSDIKKCGSNCLNPKPVAPYNRIITERSVSCYLRTDYVNDIRFKKFSIREI